MRTFRRFLNIFRKDNKVGCIPSPPAIATPSTSNNNDGVCVLDYVNTETHYNAEYQQQSRIDEITPILSLSWSSDSLSALTNDQDHDQWEHRILSLGEMKALGCFSFKTDMKYRARYMLRKKYDSLFSYQLLSNEEF